VRRMLPLLDPFDEIKQIYYSTTRETIERDLARALELLRQMPDDEARQRAAGLMHGLADLKREWAPKKKSGKRTKMRQASAPRGGTDVPPAQREAEAPPPHGPASKPPHGAARKKWPAR
jgi:hypothetical protein